MYLQYEMDDRGLLLPPKLDFGHQVAWQSV